MHIITPVARFATAAAIGFSILIGLSCASNNEEAKTASATSCPACCLASSPPISIPRVAATQRDLPAAHNLSAQVIRRGMVRIPAGEFWMGSEDPRFSDASPVHLVRLSAFWIDRDDVTNAQFEAFVAATGYVTFAERKPDAASLPGVPADLLVPGAVVFTRPAGPVGLDDPGQWWRYVPGANWRHPEGPASDLTGRADHPVVDVAWAEAAAYAAWAGKRLPTEAEWEYAARGGLDRKPYAWGDHFSPNGKLMANTFQGHFPDHNTQADGFAGTSPVGSFPPNGFGLHDMSGNVWQWCADWYQPDYYQSLAAAGTAVDPNGPATAPAPGQAPMRVMRGGSFLCTEDYCSGFMPASRGKGDPDTPLDNVGFRCVVSASPRDALPSGN